MLIIIMDTLAGYRRKALKLAVVVDLRGEEYAARIPGFRGLLATGRTKKEVIAKFNDALADWIALALKRGIGLPALREVRGPILSGV